MSFLWIVIRSSFFVEHGPFGRPASTPDQVRGRLFRITLKLNPNFADLKRQN
jgi:hypothetical protein